jgi:hypothetical protein
MYRTPHAYSTGNSSRAGSAWLGSPNPDTVIVVPSSEVWSCADRFVRHRPPSPSGEALRVAELEVVAPPPCARSPRAAARPCCRPAPAAAIPLELFEAAARSLLAPQRASSSSSDDRSTPAIARRALAVDVAALVEILARAGGGDRAPGVAGRAPGR